MTVWQVIDDCLTEGYVYGTKEAVALKVLDIVLRAKPGSLLNDLIRVEEMEVK